jgi:hypothetical protein
VRKLTVKNFSVIKEAELEFGKITVLIGPQASGKSLLCKLAYFLSKEVVDIAVDRIMSRFDFAAFENEVKKKFAEWFPRGGWRASDWFAQFILGSYGVTLSASGNASNGPSEFTLTLSEKFRNIYEEQLSDSGFRTEAVPHRALRNLMDKGFWDQVTYIPSERSYYVDTQKAYRLLENQPDPIASRFAVLYSYSINQDIPKPRLRDFLKGELKRGEDSRLFAFDDGRILPLSHLSSGSKELLPLLSVLATYEHQRPATVSAGYPTDLFFYDEFFVEEPEANIFPESQYNLVRNFAELADSDQLRPHFTITTHSPYILTAFNDLIKAGQIAAERPDKASEIEKIIPRQYWIKPGDFAAYAFDGKDGVLHPIMDPETKMINGDILDDISETISGEFGQLLEIQYGD